MKIVSAAVLLCLCTTAMSVHAQSAPKCPSLPAASNLQWQEQAAGDFLVCRASTGDGREVLSLMLTGNDPDLRFPRALRQEKDSFAGEEIYWYLPDLGGQQPPGFADRRVGVVKLDKNRYAQLALYPGDSQEREGLQAMIRSMNLNPAAVADGR